MGWGGERALKIGFHVDLAWRTWFAPWRTRLFLNRQGVDSWKNSTALKRDGLSRFLSGIEILVMNQFRFQGSHETLHRCIVSAMTLSTHRTTGAMSRAIAALDTNDAASDLWWALMQGPLARAVFVRSSFMRGLIAQPTAFRARSPPCCIRRATRSRPPTRTPWFCSASWIRALPYRFLERG